MRWVSTTVLAVLLVGLGTFYYVYEIRQAPEREKAATVKDRLWKELEGKDVDEIVVRKGGAEALAPQPSRYLFELRPHPR